MNPWEHSGVGAGTLLEYLNLAQKKQITTKDKLIETQKSILDTMENYENLAVTIKEAQDSTKVGEFINPREIREKTKTLNKISSYLRTITSNKNKVIARSLDTSPGNQLYVDQEFQLDFFKIIQISEDQSILSIANQSNKIHDATVNRLHSVLSTSPAAKTEKILKKILAHTVELCDLEKKYNTYR